MPLGRDVEPVLDHLADRIARGELVVLVGAGVSRWAGLPTWKEVACALAKELAVELERAIPDAPLRFTPPDPREPLSTETLIRIGEAYRFVLGEERLVEALRGLFRTDHLDRRDLPLHQLLVRLSDHVKAIYTTNFDDLLERAFAAAGKSFQEIVEAKDLHEWKYDRAGRRWRPRYPIYKLHGSLDRPGTLVFGESDFQRRSDLAANPLDLRFASDVVGRELLLLGYSFSDPNVRWLWTKLRDLGVLPLACFVELGESTDLDLAYFLKDRVTRVDLRAQDREHPRELLELLEKLLARCEGPTSAAAARGARRRTARGRAAAGVPARRRRSRRR
ncbi:MAG TPA: SIR2 family protein [Anaeromyxobacteraceae bacterium]|nr:SIR2 family protein [Anaeromyxobacteraceae bacterium]